MNRLLSQIVAAIIGLWVATSFVQGVSIRAYPATNFFGFPLTAKWEVIIMLGIALGLLNYFLRPLLKMLALPLELITLGLFTIIINMGLIWLLDKMFDELSVSLFLPLLYTSLIIFASEIIVGFFSKKHT